MMPRTRMWLGFRLKSSQPSAKASFKSAKVILRTAGKAGGAYVTVGADSCVIIELSEDCLKADSAFASTLANRRAFLCYGAHQPDLQFMVTSLAGFVFICYE